MKRSEINAILRDAEAFYKAKQFHLPPFAYWSPEDWERHWEASEEIRSRGLGWDITDFGSGDYEKMGLSIFTIRNGTLDALKAGRGKVYAEKIMIVGVGQVTPMHFHWQKTEDIINRGGGDLVVELYNANDDGSLAETEVSVGVDGIIQRVEAGGKIRLKPGQSVTLTTGLYHAFWGEGERVLVGEVSTVNDDNIDNRFYAPVGRFPEIEEDEDPLYYLVGDYTR